VYKKTWKEKQFEIDEQAPAREMTEHAKEIFSLSAPTLFS
jgi:hypothetical protein